MNYKTTPQLETKPIIEIEGISKEYKIGAQEKYLTLRDTIINLFKIGRHKPKPKFWALKNLNLKIHQGEVLGIIGRNGAGKSTLLKLISQITLPTTGKITIRGRVASLLEVGTGFNPELTGRENIYLNGAILGMTRREINNKFDEIVEFAEIDQFLDTPVKHYSSGMHVRLAFAVAAHLDPEILLIDEVLAVGDSRFQKKCLGKMEEIGRGGRTILFVSHNMQSIRKLCTSAILLDHGEVAATGNTNSVIKQYEGSGLTGRMHVNWGDNGPKFQLAQMMGVGVLSEGHPVETGVSTEKSIQLYIRFKVLEETSLDVTAMLHNDEGQTILISFSNHEPTWHTKKRPPGIYQSVCEIPPNLLRAGTYSVSFGLWRGFHEQGLAEYHILHFMAYEKGLVQGDIPGEAPAGVIRPLLKWTSTREKGS